MSAKINELKEKICECKSELVCTKTKLIAEQTERIKNEGDKEFYKTAFESSHKELVGNKEHTCLDISLNDVEGCYDTLRKLRSEIRDYKCLIAKARCELDECNEELTRVCNNVDELKMEKLHCLAKVNGLCHALSAIRDTACIVTEEELEGQLRKQEEKIESLKSEIEDCKCEKRALKNFIKSITHY